MIREFPDRGAQWLLEDPVHLVGLMQLLQPALAERLDVDRAQRINRTMIPADPYQLIVKSVLIQRASTAP